MAGMDQIVTKQSAAQVAINSMATVTNQIPANVGPAGLERVATSVSLIQVAKTATVSVLGNAFASAIGAVYYVIKISIIAARMSLAKTMALVRMLRLENSDVIVWRVSQVLIAN